MTEIEEIEARIALLMELLGTTIDEKAAMGMEERIAELKRLLGRLRGDSPDGD